MKGLMKIINKLLMIAVIAGIILAYNEYKYNQLKFISMSSDYKLIQEIIKLQQEIKILKTNNWY